MFDKNTNTNENILQTGETKFGETNKKIKIKEPILYDL